MTMKQLEDALRRWSDRTQISWYALCDDGEFIRLLVTATDKAEILEYLQDNYPDHFEEVA